MYQAITDATNHSKTRSDARCKKFCPCPLMHTCHPTLHPLPPLLGEAGVPSSSSDPFGPVDTLDVALATVGCIQGRRDVYRDMAGGRRGDTHLQVTLATESRLDWRGETYHLGKGYCILDKCLFS